MSTVTADAVTGESTIGVDLNDKNKDKASQLARQRQHGVEQVRLERQEALNASGRVIS